MTLSPKLKYGAMPEAISGALPTTAHPLEIIKRHGSSETPWWSATDGSSFVGLLDSFKCKAHTPTTWSDDFLIVYSTCQAEPHYHIVAVEKSYENLRNVGVYRSWDHIPAKSNAHFIEKASQFLQSMERIGQTSEVHATPPVVEHVSLPKHDKATRLAAAKRMAELWKKSGNEATDGVEYQNRMRSEWQ